MLLTGLSLVFNSENHSRMESVAISFVVESVLNVRLGFQMSGAEKCSIKKKALNTLLGYTVLRLKARVRSLWNINRRPLHVSLDM